jgi:serine/threonine protein kinase
MSRTADSSTAPSSLTSAGETQAAALTREIRNAINTTVAKVLDDTEKELRCFLPISELQDILNDKAVLQLFEELLAEIETSHDASTVIQMSENDVAQRGNKSDKSVDVYVKETTGTPSRRALLALFLRQNRPELLKVFLGWLMSHDTSAPSDDNIPFTSQELGRYGIDEILHDNILRDQAIFKPMILRRGEHHVFNSRLRLPFLGNQEPIKKGSSGSVVETEIARYHWEMEGSGGFVPENQKSSTIVALKTFKRVGPGSGLEDPTRDFQIELGVLQELRKCRTKHDMIMLDWGSITVTDYTGAPISHSLIFERAACSLEDFFKDSERAKRYSKKSELLACHVGIVEALECLHDQLKTFHLDIKPDNILIFEKYRGTAGPGKQDIYELTWKLSDFGLAKKKQAREDLYLADRSTNPSVSSTLPVTRPVGFYQAPEIQEEKISLAGPGSDVWSMGCVTIMVLAFMAKGVQEVADLGVLLKINLKGSSGTDWSFYIMNDSTSWKSRSAQKCCYITGHVPETKDLPVTTSGSGISVPLEAALHPRLIEWSNDLCQSTYAVRHERPFVEEILSVIFGNVLRINRQDRMEASELKTRLESIQKKWQRFDANPTRYVHPTSKTNNSRELRHSDQRSVRSQYSNACLEVLPEARTLDTHQHKEHDIPSTIHVSASPSSQGSTHDIHPRRPRSEDQSIRSPLSTAIRRDKASDVRKELERNPKQLDEPCRDVNIYPIHWALRNDSFRALDVLLEKVESMETTKQVCDGQTALELACASSSHMGLECIQKYRHKFEFPEEVYKRHRRGMGTEATEIADELFHTSAAPLQEKRGFFGRFKRRR